MLKRFWIALFIAYLFMRYAVEPFWVEKNRYFFHWCVGDALGILLSLLLVALFLFLAHLPFMLAGVWGRFLVEFAFVCFTAFYLKVALVETLQHYVSTGPLLEYVSKAILLAVVAVFVVFRRPVVRGLIVVCLLFSLTVPVFAITLVSARPFLSSRSVEARDDMDPGGPRVGVRKVFVFLFDEWSYRLTFANGTPSADFPNIRKAAGESVVFHNAFSPAPLTFDSLPSLLCGTVGKVELKAGRPHLTANGSCLPTDDYAHIFREMKARRLRTALYGHYHCYPELFSTGVDHCESPDVYKVFGDSPWGVCLLMLFNNAKVRFGWISPVISRPFHRANNVYHVQLLRRHHRAALSEISRDTPSFVFVHYPLPHSPFIYTRAGPRRDLATPATTSTADYLENLRYADALVGELLEAARGSADYAHTLLVLTSDHALVRDPYLRESGVPAYERCRVPLLIHLPGQEKQVHVRDNFSTAFLKKALTHYLDKKMTVDDFVGLCKSLGRSGVQCLVNGELLTVPN